MSTRFLFPICLLIGALFVGCWKAEPPASTTAAATASEGGGKLRLEDLQRSVRTEYPHKFAIIVGINDYDDSFDQDLAQAENDARGIYAALTEELGYGGEQTLLLTGTEATLDALRDSLTEWLQQQAPSRNDSVLFFFAGHGEEGSLAPVDAHPDRIAESWLPMTEVVDALAKTPCRHKLVLLDSCYSGSLFSQRIDPASERREGEAADRVTRGGGLKTDGLESYFREPCFLAITAGYDSPVDDESDGAGHSPFTAALLDAIKERALSEREDQIFFGRMLAVDVERRVMRSRKTPQRVGWGYLPGSAGGDFVFIPTIVRPSARRELLGRYAEASRAASKLILEGDASAAYDEIEEFATEPQIRRRVDYRLVRVLADSGRRGEELRAIMTRGESFRVLGPDIGLPQQPGGPPKLPANQWIALSPDERYVAVGFGDVTTVLLAATGEPLEESSLEGTHSVTFDQQGLYLTQHGAENTWTTSLENSRRTEGLGAPSNAVLQFASGGATLSHGGVRPSARTASEPLKQPVKLMPLRNVDVHSRYCLAYDSQLSLYRVDGRTDDRVALDEKHSPSLAAAISPSGNRLARFDARDRQLTLRTIGEDADSWSIELLPTFLPLPAALRFSPDEQLLIVTAAPPILDAAAANQLDPHSRHVAFIDVETGEPTLVLKGLPDYVVDFTFSRSSETLWVLYGNGLIERWGD